MTQGLKLVRPRPTPPMALGRSWKTAHQRNCQPHGDVAPALMRRRCHVIACQRRGMRATDTEAKHTPSQKQNSAALSALHGRSVFRTPPKTGGRPRRPATACARRAAAAGPGARQASSAGGPPPRAPAPRRAPPPGCPRCGPCACRVHMDRPQSSNVVASACKAKESRSSTCDVCGEAQMARSTSGAEK